MISYGIAYIPCKSYSRSIYVDLNKFPEADICMYRSFFDTTKQDRNDDDYVSTIFQWIDLFGGVIPGFLLGSEILQCSLAMRMYVHIYDEVVH